MIREILVAGAIAAAALGAVPPAAADPGPLYPDKPGHYATDVPGMDYDAHLTGPCPNRDRFTFGRGPGGEALQCRFIAFQGRPVPPDTGFWQISYELRGVQDIGAPCPDPQSAAQAPDGRPLLCMSSGWQAGYFTVGGFQPTAG